MSENSSPSDKTFAEDFLSGGVFGISVTNRSADSELPESGTRLGSLLVSFSSAQSMTID